MNMLAIRPATNKDIDAIMQLEAHGFPAPIRESRDVMQTRLDHFPQGFLVLDGHTGTLAGYFCSELWDASIGYDTSAFTVGHDIRDVHQPDGSRLYISSMTIHPDWRGNGLGRQFFVQCLARVRQQLPQIRQSTLMLSAEWSGAHRIYQRVGYTEVMRLSQFFSQIAEQDSDAIVMHKDFT